MAFVGCSAAVGVILIVFACVNGALTPPPWAAFHAVFLALSALFALALAFPQYREWEAAAAITGMHALLNLGQALGWAVLLMRDPDGDNKKFIHPDDIAFYLVAAVMMGALAVWLEFYVSELPSLPREGRRRYIGMIVVAGICGVMLWLMGIPAIDEGGAHEDHPVPGWANGMLRCITSIGCYTMVYAPWARHIGSTIWLAIMLVVLVCVAVIPVNEIVMMTLILSIILVSLPLLYKHVLLPRKAPGDDGANGHIKPQLYGKSREEEEMAAKI